eukprot:scaffold95873_cov66-Phaeocystis_antarctica.AAC.2
MARHCARHASRQESEHRQPRGCVLRRRQRGGGGAREGGRRAGARKSCTQHAEAASAHLERSPLDAPCRRCLSSKHSATAYYGESRRLLNTNSNPTTRVTTLVQHYAKHSAWNPAKSNPFSYSLLTHPASLVQRRRLTVQRRQVLSRTARRVASRATHEAPEAQPAVLVKSSPPVVRVVPFDSPLPLRPEGGRGGDAIDPDADAHG